jgi:hypothetical protein
MLPLGDDNEGARGLPVMTLALILVNVLVFVYEMTLDAAPGGELERFVREYGVIPAEIQRGQDWFTLITSMFVHGGRRISGDMPSVGVGDYINGVGNRAVCGVYFGTELARVWRISGLTAEEDSQRGSQRRDFGILGAYICCIDEPETRAGCYYVTAVPAFLFWESGS